MAFPKYFKKFPNIDYALSINKAGRTSNVSIKDYFHLMKIADMSFKDTTLFYTYHVQNGERPEQVSFKEYGDEQYYWVVLQTNEIVDFYSDWPLSDYEFDKFVTKKYGSDDVLYATHHYETRETKDGEGTVVLPGGIKVDENYIFTYPFIPGDTTYRTAISYSVSNYEYERRLNEAKAEIILIDEKYLYNYVDEYTDYINSLSLLSSGMDIADYYK